MTSQFTWIPIYEELADELVNWQNRQEELIAFLEGLRERGYTITPFNDKGEDGSVFLLNEIDPFTFYGVFNRGITTDKRTSILAEIKQFFNLKSEIPSDFDGIPIVNPQQSWFIAYKKDRDLEDVDRLWHVFQLALNENPIESHSFLEAFNQALKVKYTSFNLTMGLFWIRPHTFLSLDTKNREYLDIDLPSSGLTSKFYIDTIRLISSNHKSFPKLSYDAWIAKDERGTNSGEVIKVKDTEGASLEYRSDNIYWVFQCNPRLYDIESAIQNLDYLSFTVNQHKSDIRKNDFVFLWISGDNAGIIATAKIISNPEVIAHDTPEESNYAIDKERFEGEQLRVRIKIQDILKSRLTKEQLLENPNTANMTIIKSPQGTNFPLSKAEAQALLGLLNRIGKSPKSIEIIYTFDDLQNDLGFPKNVLEDWLAALARKKQVIFYGPPGTGKTYAARKIAQYIASKHQGIVDIIQFHPSYAYEDFIQGIRPKTTIDGHLEYSIEKGRLLKFCDRASMLEAESVLIIDEINRAELSRVFGELMYLLEYRNETITLANGENFSFPNNIYIIGTMNTADRSIALVDHALRRRFSFIRLFPDYDLLLKYHQNTGFNAVALVEILKNINREIGDLNYAVGITFFLSPNIKREIKSIWQMEIEPYLEEYFFDDQNRVASFRWGKIEETLLN